MGSILIHTDNKEELHLIKAIANKMGFKSEILSKSDKEDVGLAMAMEDNDPSETLTLEEAVEYYKTIGKK